MTSHDLQRSRSFAYCKRLRDPIEAVAKRHGVSEASIYVWRNRFGDMGADDETDVQLRAGRQPAKEDFGCTGSGDRGHEGDHCRKVVSVQARLAQARYAIDRGVSQRRACALLQVARSGLAYTCKMPIKDAPIVQAMRHYSGK